MIFPEFENIDLIDRLREKYDPLADKVCPHITLVFPFESSFSMDEIAEILRDRLAGIKPFQVSVNGLSSLGRWMFLDMSEGADSLCKIHNALYEHEFTKYKPVWMNTYTPHITVGVFDTPEAAQEACEMEKDFKHVFTCLVDKVTVEIIGDDERSIIEVEYLLD